MTDPRISKDPMLYGVEFRCVEGVLQHRDNPPECGPSEWEPLFTIERGKIVCERGWSPARLRIWAGLLERPNRRRSVTSRRPSRS